MYWAILARTCEYVLGYPSTDMWVCTGRSLWAPRSSAKERQTTVLVRVPWIRIRSVMCCNRATDGYASWTLLPVMGSWYWAILARACEYVLGYPSTSWLHHRDMHFISMYKIITGSYVLVCLLLFYSYHFQLLYKPHECFNFNAHKRINT